MRSFPATGWTITHVHADDLVHPSPARPARVLLQRERTPGHLLPARGDAHQLSGTVLEHVDALTWRPIDPRREWKAGYVPVVTSGDERIEFITADTLALRRHREADRLLAAAFGPETPSDRSERLHQVLLGHDVRTPIGTQKCLEHFGAALVGASLGAPRLLCASSVSRETGPVIALAPQATASGIGAIRFAIAHQLGHLLDPDTDGAETPCALAGADPDDRGNAREAFANAFAVYLLAPLPAVQSLVRGVDLAAPSVLFDATADVATVFGLSAGAALRHVLNCAGAGDFARDLGRALSRAEWPRRREAIDAEVEAAWATDRQFVSGAIGAMKAWSPEAALRRPSATRFDELTARALSTGLIEQAEAEALRAA